MKQKVYKKKSLYKRIRHYLRIWRRIVKSGLKRSFFNKKVFVARLFRTAFVIGAQLLLLDVIFSGSGDYVGWTKPQTYLVLGIWNVVNYSCWSLFGINFNLLQDKVLSGSFDYTLLKPVSSWCLASFGDFFIHNLVNVLSGFVLIGYYIYMEWGSISIFNCIFLIFAILISIVICYFIFLFFASFIIAEPRTGTISISKELVGVTKYPIDIFGSSLSFVFYTFVPIGFITTVPANLLIGRTSYVYLLYGLFVTVLLGIISIGMWNRNLKKYCSMNS
ncbi:ABC-2 family transporter protein [bacterium]|nr:ABC-2 family transporter protein [bacterium]